MWWLLVLVQMPGLLAYLRADGKTPKAKAKAQDRALRIWLHECVVALVLFTVHILGGI